jgi:hypothetical protein
MHSDAQPILMRQEPRNRLLGHTDLECMDGLCVRLLLLLLLLLLLSVFFYLLLS